MKESKTETNMLVTVIIPVYNIQEYIEECITSVSKQTYKNLEIIVVDDGSTDNSYDVIKECEKKDDRIVAIHKENGGLSSARNSGLDVAHGDFIMFVDGDDYIALDAIGKCVDIIRDDKSVDLVMFDFESFIGNPTVDDNSGEGEKTLIKSDELLHMLAVEEPGIVIACAKLYRASVWNDLRFPVGLTREDEYVSTDVFQHINSAVRIRNKLYFYRMREGSITHSNSKKSREDTLKAFKHRMELLCNGSEDDALYKFRYIEAVMDLYCVSNSDERMGLWHEFLMYFSMGSSEILWKRRVLVLIFRICPALYVRLRGR